MNRRSPLLVFFVLLVMASYACSGTSIFATPTPTNTPTPTPTNTPTPTPTNTPKPIPGIDTAVSVQDVTFKFISAKLTREPYVIGDRTLTPNDGYSTLVLRGVFSGNLFNLFTGPYQSVDSLYVNDGTGNQNWVQVNLINDEITIGFFVKTNALSYVLHNTVDTPWSVDLSPFLQ